VRGVWVAKAVIQKGISVLPNAQRVNRRFQDMGGRLGTSGPPLQRLEWAGRHLRTFDELGAHAGGPRPTGFRVLELGSGWHPIVPLVLMLGGADEVMLCDLEDLSDARLLGDAIDAVLASADSGDLAELVPGILPERLERLRVARKGLDRDGRFITLARLGLKVAPGDVRELRPAEAPDLIVSNTVLEHIAPPVLVGILGSFARMAAPGTVMSHLVDMCDHYLYVDGSLTPYHFLRYTERQWRWIDNSVQPMNRLRVQQYQDIYRDAGVQITRERRGDGTPADLAGVRLAPPFSEMGPDDVACKSVWFDTLF